MNPIISQATWAQTVRDQHLRLLRGGHTDRLLLCFPGFDALAKKTLSFGIEVLKDGRIWRRRVGTIFHILFCSGGLIRWEGIGH